MNFEKEHLKHSSYDWTTQDVFSETTVPRQPSRRLFDRNNGNHLLYMINFFGNYKGDVSLETAQKVEELITNQLPLGIRSELSVFNWLKQTYN